MQVILHGVTSEVVALLEHCEDEGLDGLQLALHQPLLPREHEQVRLSLACVVIGAGSPSGQVELARPGKHHDVLAPPLRGRPIAARAGRRRDEQRRKQNLGRSRKPVAGLVKMILHLAHRRSLQHSMDANECIR